MQRIITNFVDADVADGELFVRELGTGSHAGKVEAKTEARLQFP